MRSYAVSLDAAALVGAIFCLMLLSDDSNSMEKLEIRTKNTVIKLLVLCKKL